MSPYVYEATSSRVIIPVYRSDRIGRARRRIGDGALQRTGKNRRRS